MLASAIFDTGDFVSLPAVEISEVTTGGGKGSRMLGITGILR